MARNEREARRVLLARLPTLEHARLGGHTGGNLLLSMMERYSGDFLAAVEGLRVAARRAPATSGRSASSPASLCAQYGDGSTTRGEVEVDAGQSAGHMIARLWLEPWVNIHPGGRAGDPAVRRRDHRARQLLHEPDADLSRARRARSHPAGEGAGRARLQPAHRRARDVALHRRRGGARDEPPSSAGRSTSSSSTPRGRPKKPWRATARSTSGRSRVGDVPEHVRGRDRRLLVGRIARHDRAASRTPSGPCSRGGCSSASLCSVRRAGARAAGRARMRNAAMMRRLAWRLRGGG